MTIDTCRGALCGSTLQSSRRSAEAANPDRALDEVRLRIAASRMADHEPGRADGEEESQRPLHPGFAAEPIGAAAEFQGEDRRYPAAEGAGDDVERPMHADD